MILDGWHRYRACQELGIKPLMREWAGECSSLDAHVVSMNLHRRHLNESQRAMIAADIAKLPQGRPSETQVTDSEPDSLGNRHKCRFSEMTQQQAAELLNVGERSVRDANVVLTEGTEAERAAVRQGTARVKPLAARIRTRNAQPELAQKKAGKLLRPATNVHRIDNQRVKAALYNRVRDSVMNLAEMPRACDVVEVVRKVQRSHVVGEKLPKALKWLQEFCSEWEVDESREGIEEEMR